jgi:hypothetical protein
MPGRAKFVVAGGIALGLALCLFVFCHTTTTQPTPSSVTAVGPTEPESESSESESEPVVTTQSEADATISERSESVVAAVPGASPGNEGPTPSATPVEEIEYAQDPIALSEPDYGAGQWTQDQLDILYRLRQEFTTAVVGSGLNPTIPGYFDKWQEAQQISDQKFQAFFGTDAYLRQRARAAAGMH